MTNLNSSSFLLLVNINQDSEINNKHNIFGLFSSSLFERTSLDSKIIKKTIQENDNEIFIFSPSQYNFFIYYNFWDQAEVWHKGIVDEIKMIYSLKDNFPSIDTHTRTSKIGFSYCNYWAAKKKSFIKIVLCISECLRIKFLVILSIKKEIKTIKSGP